MAGGTSTFQGFEGSILTILAYPGISWPSYQWNWLLGVVTRVVAGMIPMVNKWVTKPSTQDKSGETSVTTHGSKLMLDESILGRHIIIAYHIISYHIRLCCKTLLGWFPKITGKHFWWSRCYSCYTFFTGGQWVPSSLLCGQSCATFHGSWWAKRKSLLQL